MTTTVATIARGWAILCLTLGWLACSRPGGGGSPHTGLRAGALVPLAGQALSTLEPVDADELIEAVSQLRELPFGQPVTIGEVDDEGLREMVSGMLDSPRGRSVFVGDAHTMLAFNTASSAASLAPARLVPVLSAELGGYFDPKGRRVYVRRREAGTCSWQWRTTVVHELTHALQHEHFGSLEPEGGGEDEWLASRALVEGDARLISMLYITAQDGYPKGRVLHMLAGGTFLGAIVEDPLAALPSAVRARLSFEYWEGAAFAATLVRAGGMALLDRAFEQPPSTTEQVLHPAKYLAGEPAVTVNAPALPRGYRTVTSGTRGELLIRVMGERCLPATQAQVVASGWGGDAFVIGQQGRGPQALLWRTVWDTTADAKEFMDALAQRPACWSTESEGGPPVDRRHLARRRGRQVALARGLDERQLQSSVRHMLGSPLVPAQRRPLAKVAIPPLSTITPRRAGEVTRSTYRSPWLGVGATVPVGWRGEIPAAGRGATYANELVVSDGLNQGWVFLYDRQATARVSRQIVDEVRLEVQARRQVVMSLLDERRVDTALGAGRRWAYANGPGEDDRLTVVLIPMCGGTGSLVIASRSTSARGRETLDRWAASFRPVPGGESRPPVCSGLDPR